MMLRLFLLLPMAVIGQEINLYAPMHTHHWNRDADYLEHLTDNEGGNMGIIASFRKLGKGTYSEWIAGGYRNSYGDFSVVGGAGVGIQGQYVSIGIITGLVSGYRKAFEKYGEGLVWNKDGLFYRHQSLGAKGLLPKFMQNNGIIPLFGLSIQGRNVVQVGKASISPAVLINTEFINFGMVASFKTKLHGTSNNH